MKDSYKKKCFMCGDTSNVISYVDGSQACKECKVWWYNQEITQE